MFDPDLTRKMIEGPDAEAMKKAQTRWDSIAKPLGSLGLLESAVVKIAGLTGADNARICTIVYEQTGILPQNVTIIRK